MLFKTNTNGHKHPDNTLFIIEQDTIGEIKENNNWHSTQEPRTQKNSPKTAMLPLVGFHIICTRFSQNWPFLSFQLCIVRSSIQKIKLSPDLNFDCNRYEWPDIWHADVSWPPPKHHFDLVKQAGFRVYRIFFRLHLTWWCILKHSRNSLHFAHGLLIFTLWQNFDIMKRVKFAVSMHCLRMNGMISHLRTD